MFFAGGRYAAFSVASCAMLAKNRELFDDRSQPNQRHHYRPVSRSVVEAFIAVKLPKYGNAGRKRERAENGSLDMHQMQWA
jgi:hypothetical protein